MILLVLGAIVAQPCIGTTLPFGPAWRQVFEGLPWRSPLQALDHRKHQMQLSTRWKLASAIDYGPEKRANLSFRVIVINLDRRQDRLAEFLASMKEQQPWLLPHVCRLSAVDGHNSTAIQLLQDSHLISAEWRNAESLTGGMVGCYASHWQALGAIVEDDSLDFGVVVEDDLMFYAPAFQAEFQRLWNNTDGKAAKFWNKAEWVSLQQDGSGWPKGGTRSSRPTRLRPRTQVEWPKNTGMYAVSRKAARRLAGVSRSRSSTGLMMPIRRELDTMLPLYLQQMWMFDPPIAQARHMLQPGGDSDARPVLQANKMPLAPDVRASEQAAHQVGDTLVKDCRGQVDFGTMLAHGAS